MVHPDLLLSTMFPPCGARSSPAAQGQRGGDECWREAEHIDTGAPLTVTPHVYMTCTFTGLSDTSELEYLHVSTRTG